MHTIRPGSTWNTLPETKQILKTMNVKKYILLAILALCFSCKHTDNTEDTHVHETGKTSTGKGKKDTQDHHSKIHLSQQQFETLDMRVDTLPVRKMDVVVETNGELEVPPQNEASVTAIIGANVVEIEVIEGDKISKGQVLAYLSHPDLIRLQTDYISNWHELHYLKNEYERQKKLYEENVGSGKDFQKIKAEYLSGKGLVVGLEAQLKQMGLNIEKLQDGDIYERVPVRSPIPGNVQKVEVKTGQYVPPEHEMFSLVNIDHIHADFMVYEKDIRKVEKGQTILFTVQSLPEEEFRATIYSVGTAFEKDPKAVHIHAEIENKNTRLLPGMYVRGKIFGDSRTVTALPHEAIITEADGSYIFSAKADTTGGETSWDFERIKIRTGKTSDEWMEIKLLQPLPAGAKIAQNNAYYLEAELKKGETGHSH